MIADKSVFRSKTVAAGFLLTIAPMIAKAAEDSGYFPAGTFDAFKACVQPVGEFLAVIGVRDLVGKFLAARGFEVK